MPYGTATDSGLAGYGVITARPGPEDGFVTVEVGVQPETVVAQVRARIAERLRTADRKIVGD